MHFITQSPTLQSEMPIFGVMCSAYAMPSIMSYPSFEKTRETVETLETLRC